MNLAVETEDSFSNLLELAANNDLTGFKISMDEDPSAIDEVGLWYGRKKGSNQMVLQHRTPLMVAATYGSLDVMKLILLSSAADVNMVCMPDNTTALHCAASGGSENAIEAVKLLLSAGADPNIVDANGLRPADVVLVSPKLVDTRHTFEHILGSCSIIKNIKDEYVSPRSDSTSMKLIDHQPLAASEKKEYPVDPSLPDIKNSIFGSDEFRMYSFKVRPCSRAYSHDWTECPFVHPGENARRRDPRKFHYSCIPCPDFRKGACRRGDMCGYAHGVFECWLHPAQYRTRLCKDGVGCSRKVCFFAHTKEELRPVYMPTGSTSPSPRFSSSPNAFEFASTAMGLMPVSPSSPYSAAMAPFMTPISPLGENGPLGSWPQPNVPTLHLPGSNLHSSRLRSSLNARDILMDEPSMASDFEAQQLLNDLYLSRLGSLVGSRNARSKTLAPSNLSELFASEVALSPRYNNEQGAVFSPSHKSALLSQFQQQQQLLTPINTRIYSSTSMDTQGLLGHSSLLQGSHGISSPGRISPRSIEPLSPLSPHAAAGILQSEKQTLRSLSSHGFCARTSGTWSEWGCSASGVVNRRMECGDLDQSSSFEDCSAAEEPDLSWVHSLVKEPLNERTTMSFAGPMASMPSSGVGGGGGGSGGGGGGGGVGQMAQMDGQDHSAALGAWLEQMQLDQLVA